MYVISVSVIGKGLFKETLSYFSLQKDISLGSLVSVPVRNKLVTGIVVSVEEALKQKASLKQAAFPLRKLAKLKSKPLFLRAFMEALKETSEYFAGTTGGTLSGLVSSAILNSGEISIQHRETQKIKQSLPEKYALEAGESDRLSVYKSLVRERFARGESVFFCFPTLPEAEPFFESLQKGIEAHAFLLHSQLSRKKLALNWRKALEHKHPVLVMSTGAFLSLPRRDFSLFILEKESSRFYKGSTRPYLDVRVFAEKLAEKSGASLILGDSVLRVETRYRLEQNELLEFDTLRTGGLEQVNSEIVYPQGEIGADKNRKKFSALSPELSALISLAQKNQESLFIFANRRGLSPLTLCQDCGTAVACNTCHATAVLHRAREGNIFFCHRCGERRSAEERCRYCDSWRLSSFGIGLELVEEEVRKLVPQAPIFKLDRDSVKNHKQAVAVTSKFYATPGSILLGTEMALYYLHKKIEYTAAAAFDSLFALPDFRMSERIFSLLLALRSLASKRFLIQTRNRENNVVTEAAKGNIHNFFKEELELRRLFNYPPWSRLIRISTEGPKETVEKHRRWLMENLADLDPLVSPAPLQKKGRHLQQILLTFARKDWPKREVIERLRALPLVFKVEVDPEHSL